MRDRTREPAGRFFTTGTLWTRGFANEDEMGLLTLGLFWKAGLEVDAVVVPAVEQPDVTPDFPTPMAFYGDLLVLADRETRLLLDPSCVGCLPGEVLPHHAGRPALRTQIPQKRASTVTLVQASSSTRIERTFASYARTVSSEGGATVIHETLRLPWARLEVSQLGAWRAFLAEVRVARRAAIVVVGPARTAAR